MKNSTGVAFILSAACVVLSGTTWAQQDATPAAQPETSAAPAKHASSSKAAAAALNTPKEKQSYAIGMQLGEAFKKQGLDIDLNVLTRGIKDTVAGKSLMTAEEEKSTIMELQMSMRKAMQEKMQKEAAKNKSEGEAFLSANKSKQIGRASCRERV